MNAIDQNGIQTDTAADTLDKFLNGFTSSAGVRYPGMLEIYGENINVNPNSPDGQFIGLGVQFTQDILQFIQQAYSSFDPDQAVGVQLDQRCAINGVIRNAGTYTYTNVTVTATQAVTINGLDTAPNAPFTVSDSAGNQFVLLATYAFGGAGSVSLAFRASSLGLVEITANTLTNIVTITLGISSVNNPAAPTSTGTNEETDYNLRIRRARSVALPSRGYFDGLYGALVDIDSVTSVKLLENTTGSTDANGVPGHSIWAIVAAPVSTAINNEIANAIYVKRNAGCGMKGSVSVPVTQVDNSLFAVLFDRPTAQNLWIQLSVHPITGTVDTTYLKNQLLAALTSPTENSAGLLPYGIGQSAVASVIAAFVQSLAPNVAISAEGVSTAVGGPFVSFVDPTAVNYQFATSLARITITEI